VPRNPAQGIAFILGFWLAFALSPLIAKPAGGAESSDLASLEASLLTQVNRVRSDHHLVPLVRRSDLDQVALGHSTDMARRGYFSHQSPEGANPVHRLQQQGVTDMRLAAENLGKTTHSDPSAEIVRSWLRSPDHRGNLLAPALNFTGIGIVQDANGSLIYTQVYILVPKDM
jgi:uncharacterized protein YkwD